MHSFFRLKFKNMFRIQLKSILQSKLKHAPPYRLQNHFLIKFLTTKNHKLNVLFEEKLSLFNVLL